VLDPGLGSLLRRICGHTGVDQANGHKNGKGLQDSDIEGKAERTGAVQHGEEVAQGYLITVCKYLMRVIKGDGARLLVVPGDSTRINKHKMKSRKTNLSIRKKNNAVKLVKQWEKLPRDVVESLSLKILKI